MHIRSSLSLAGLLCVSACSSGGSSGLDGIDAGSGSMLSDGGARGVAPPERLDLLLMIDNSWAMDSKHVLLADGIARLLERLENPACVTATGSVAGQPEPSAECPAGQRREFRPIRDIHVGVISSSLGDAGDGALCSQAESREMSHLIGSLERGAITGVSQDGVLKWRAGESFESFRGTLTSLIVAAGQRGCGYEQSLEAWYRFLVDPKPYASLERVRCRPEDTTTACTGPAVTASGEVALDETVIEQRAAFLRPDSLLVIVTLSDENDCSIRVGGQSWRVASSQAMPRAAGACSENPNATCCYPCGGVVPDGCSPDPLCASTPLLTPEEDSPSLRCFAQKRRFGADFLYPTERYVNALSRDELCLESPSLGTDGCSQGLTDNPLFAQGRSHSHVVLASIAGVPWQSIRETTGSDDISFRLKTYEELNAGGWDDILGQPGRDPPIAPADPFMAEASNVRAGIGSGNSINGRDYDTAYGGTTPRDLQHACLFRLSEPVDCGTADPSAGLPCACDAAVRDSPVCEDRPGESAAGPIQYWARAYPGVRHLEVLRGQGATGGDVVLGSICSNNAADTSRAEYGYRPVADALLARIAPKLQAR